MIICYGGKAPEGAGFKLRLPLRKSSQKLNPSGALAGGRTASAVKHPLGAVPVLLLVH